MIKQASTIGAILLTTMVLLRANVNIEDTQHTPTFENKLLKRAGNQPENVAQFNQERFTIGAKSSFDIDFKSTYLIFKQSIKKDVETANLVKDIKEKQKVIKPLSTKTELQQIEEHQINFSLDETNTINTGMSLLFPRQEIQSRSNRQKDL
ncbi:hypothetical protein [Crocinitomix algicola]|uniref:hypothetical protein n=1 Tax=Crocinitomix algicola TaxID=1740263 RepID=UPI00082C14ED|nr:hypothetical protein [Crocinitomix algicola]